MTLKHPGAALSLQSRMVASIHRPGHQATCENLGSASGLDARAETLLEGSSSLTDSSVMGFGHGQVG